jgi:hypothetical protein
MIGAGLARVATTGAHGRIVVVRMSSGGWSDRWILGVNIGRGCIAGIGEPVPVFAVCASILRSWLLANGRDAPSVIASRSKGETINGE